MSQCFKYILKNLPLLCLCFLITQPTHAEQSAINKDIQRLEKKFKDLSTEFYQTTSNYKDEYSQPITDIDQLLSVVTKLHNKHPIAAIQLIHINKKTVIENLDSSSIFKFIELLLDNNEWNLANDLLEEINSANDQSILATVQFTFAKYYAQHHQWQQANTLLEGSFAQLSEENTAYAYLLNGVALQHLKKHRPAIKNYKKIPKSSQYYSFAQLNFAIANIRQGWWTDGQTKIREQLKHANKTNEDELTNRLYLILGYALLQREYYRDARNAFRHIGVDSRYTNRALLGIGLTATSQGDYVGALNALTILKDKKTFDLSVDESYLLVPYIYEKLQQEITATSTYSEALKYYQQRMNALDALAASDAVLNDLEYKKETSSLIVQNNNLDYGSRYPESFMTDLQQLKKFNKINNDPKIKNKISKLITQFNSTLQKIIADLINERKEYLKSYLNQSRYGLARLYDNSQKAED